MSFIICLILIAVIVLAYIVVLLPKSTKNKEEAVEPVEFKYFNPLKAKIGQFITFSDEPILANINFAINKIIFYATNIGKKKFMSADYCLKANILTRDKPVRFRLRLIADENANNDYGCKLQILEIVNEMAFDQGLYDLCMHNGDHDDKYDDPNEVTFKVNYDDDGKELEIPNRYWRCEDAPDPYHAEATEIGPSFIPNTENVTYWDFSRITKDEGGQDKTENLVVEMDNNSRSFMVLRGPDIKAFQIQVV